MGLIYDHSLTTTLRAGSSFTAYKVWRIDSSDSPCLKCWFHGNWDKAHGTITSAGTKSLTRTYSWVDGVGRRPEAGSGDPVPAFTEADDGKQCNGDGLWVWLNEEQASQLAAGLGDMYAVVPVTVSPADVAIAGTTTFNVNTTPVTGPAAILDGLTVAQADFEPLLPHAHVTGAFRYMTNMVVFLIDPDHEYTLESDISGFLVDNQPPIDVDEVAGDSATFVYDFETAPGMNWQVIGGAVGTFSPPALLAPASGNLA